MRERRKIILSFENEMQQRTFLDTYLFFSMLKFLGVEFKTESNN